MQNSSRPLASPSRFPLLQRIGPALMLGAALLVLYYLYRQAQGLTWQFDDEINLKGLRDASSRQGLLDFVFGGVAGPSGRPLSLAAFLPNYADWPNNPWGFVKASLLWHGMNALWLFMWLKALLGLWREEVRQPVWVASSVAVIWLLLPLHASSLLMPVQRMTLIASFFVLATLTIYTWLRIRLAESKGRSLPGALMLVLVCAIGTGLGFFSKESAILLTLFVPLVEWFFIQPKCATPLPPKLWNAGLALAACAVPVAVLYQLASGGRQLLEYFINYRGYTLLEQTATQPVILWEYLKQLAVPRAAQLGPFHDGHVVFSWGQWQPWLAIIVGGILLAVAALTARRGSWLGRCALFAGLFFLAGHLLESTLLPLELYFEHRNYLAVIGLLLFFCLALAAFARQAESVVLAGLIALPLAGIQLFALQQITSQWGQPLLAGEIWYRNQPDSPRAAQYLSTQYARYDFHEAAIRILDQHAAPGSGRVGVGIQALFMACKFEPAERQAARIDALIGEVPRLVDVPGVTTGLKALGDRIRAGECEGVAAERYQALLETLEQHPKIIKNPRIRHHVRFELALMAKHAGQGEEEIRWMQQSFHDFPSLSIATVIASTLFQNGQIDEAIAWLDQLLQDMPDGMPIHAESSLSSMRAALKDIHQQMQAAEAEEADQERVR